MKILLIILLSQNLDNLSDNFYYLYSYYYFEKGEYEKGYKILVEAYRKTKKLIFLKKILKFAFKHAWWDTLEKFGKEIELSPLNADLHAYVAYGLLMNEKFNKAKKIINYYCKANIPEFYYLKGLYYYLKNEEKKTLKFFNRAYELKDEFSDIIFYERFGIDFFELDKEKGYKILSEVTHSTTPYFWKTYQCLGEYFGDKGDYLVALFYYYFARLANPESPSLYFSLLNFFSKYKDTSSIEAVQHSIETFLDFSVEKNLLLGFSNYLLKKFDRSLTYFLAAIKMIEKIEEKEKRKIYLKFMYFYVALIFYKKGNLEKASQYIDEAIKIDEMPAFLYFKSLFYFKDQNYKKALSYINKAIKKIKEEEKERLFPLYLLKISIHSSLKDTQNALKIVDNLFKTINEDPDAMLSLIDNCIKNGLQSRAKRFINYMMKKYKNDTKILHSLALFLGDLKEYEKADSLFRIIIAKEDSLPEILNNWGYTLLMWGKKMDTAEIYIKKAFEQKPWDPYILDSMAWLCFLKGEYIDALYYIEKALKEDPDDENIYEHAIKIYKKLNLEKRLKECLKEAREKFPYSEKFKKIK